MITEIERCENQLNYVDDREQFRKKEYEEWDRIKRGSDYQYYLGFSKWHSSYAKLVTCQHIHRLRDRFPLPFKTDHTDSIVVDSGTPGMLHQKTANT